MAYIESAKTYTGNSLETIFFRPMLTGPSAEDLGVKVVYNMPIPTTVQFWEGHYGILQKYTTNGWNGGTNANKLQKTINLSRVKAEMSFSAADYFSLVFEQIAARSDVNMDDLTGTELEVAETEIFRKSIAESIRATMWIGDTEKNGSYCTFDGFLKTIIEYIDDVRCPTKVLTEDDMADPATAIKCFKETWDLSFEKLKSLKSEGQLVYFVTSSIYDLYQDYLDAQGVESSYHDTINGRPALMYRGIPVVDANIDYYLNTSDIMQNYCILTDRRNLVMAVNTNDFPGSEIRMWYNPDEMENRQRATFMIGCDVIDHELVSVAYLPIP